MNAPDRLVTSVIVTKKDLNTSNKDINGIIKDLLALIQNQVSNISSGGIRSDGNIELSCKRIDVELNKLQGESEEKFNEIRSALNLIRFIFSGIEELAGNLERCTNLQSCIAVLECTKKLGKEPILTNRVLCIILRKCETIEEAEDLIGNSFKGLKLDIYTYIELVKIIVRQNNISLYGNKLIKYLNALNNIKGAGTGAEFQNALRSLKGNFGVYSDLVENHIKGIKGKNNLLSLLQK